MQRISYKRRFPHEVIQHAVRLCFRFTLSFRDVEEMLAYRGIEVSYETIRCGQPGLGAAAVRTFRSFGKVY